MTTTCKLPRFLPHLGKWESRDCRDGKHYRVVDSETLEPIVEPIVWADSQLGVYARYVKDGKFFVMADPPLREAKKELVHRNIRIMIRPDVSDEIEVEIDEEDGEV